MWQFAPALLFLMAAIQPTPKSQLDWRWSREGVGCSLEQAYSNEGKVVTISRTPGNDQSSISIGEAEPILATSKEYAGGKIAFFPGGEADVRIYVTTEGKRRQVVAQSDDTNFLSKLSQASEFEIGQNELGSVRAPLRSAGAAVQAIRKCEDSRMREWGIDPVAWRSLKARPVPTKSWTEWLSAADYPAAAIFAGAEGYIISRLEVGPDGIATGCISLNRNRPARYRDRICAKLMHRARFQPALDSSGKPTAAPYVLIIRFRLA